MVLKRTLCHQKILQIAPMFCLLRIFFVAPAAIVCLNVNHALFFHQKTTYNSLQI